MAMTAELEGLMTSEYAAPCGQFTVCRAPCRCLSIRHVNGFSCTSCSQMKSCYTSVLEVSRQQLVTQMEVRRDTMAVKHWACETRSRT